MTTETKTRGRKAPPRDAGDARTRLIETAERLFAERGIDAVSLRLINREAGERNTSSIHYYFGDRAAVIEAVVERRMSAINARRLAEIAEMRADGRDRSLRDVVAAYVRPLADQMSRGAESPGSAYVRFLAQAYASAEIDIPRLARGRWDQSLQAVVEMARALLPDLPEAVFRERTAVFFRGVVYALADRERDDLTGRARPGRLPLPDFVEDVIDMQTAALSAPART